MQIAQKVLARMFVEAPALSTTLVPADFDAADASYTPQGAGNIDFAKRSQYVHVLPNLSRCPWYFWSY